MVGLPDCSLPIVSAMVIRRCLRPLRNVRAALVPLLAAACLLTGACSATVPGIPQVPGAATVVTGQGADSGGGSVVASGAVEPYVVKGRVTTAAGDPLPGAEVWADNTLAYNSNALAVSGPDGSYRIELPRSDQLTWRMGGHIVTTYQGVQFDLDLAVDATPFASAVGAIRDFQWRLQGTHDDDADLFYGGLVYVYEDVNHNELGDGGWKVTFTPDGPLIDGSTGQSFSRDVVGGQIKGVPIGRYTVSATYLPAGGSSEVPLNIRQRDTGDYAPSATAGFRKDSVPVMELEIVKP